MQSLRACIHVHSFAAYSVRVPYFPFYVQDRISGKPAEMVLIPSALGICRGPSLLPMIKFVGFVR